MERVVMERPPCVRGGGGERQRSGCQVSSNQSIERLRFELFYGKE